MAADAVVFGRKGCAAVVAGPAVAARPDGLHTEIRPGFGIARPERKGTDVATRTVRYPLAVGLVVESCRFARLLEQQAFRRLHVTAVTAQTRFLLPRIG